MREYSLAEQFSLIALNGLDSKYDTEAKKAAVIGIAAAIALEETLLKSDIGAGQSAESENRDSESVEKSLDLLAERIGRLKKLRKRQRKEVEQGMTARLEEAGVLTEIPSLLGCDINYYTAGITMMEYKCLESLYQNITETIRAEILEPGEVTLETVCFLWLLRECGGMHDLFSVAEQNRIEQSLVALKAQEPVYNRLLELEFHNAARNMYLGFLHWKRNLFKNPYLAGVNLLFPFFERRQAVFIDMVLLGTSVKERREEAVDFLKKNGHYCQIMEIGGESLVKVDNCYYRIWPSVRSSYHVPVQGVELLPVYK